MDLGLRRDLIPSVCAPPLIRGEAAVFHHRDSEAVRLSGTASHCLTVSVVNFLALRADLFRKPGGEAVAGLGDVFGRAGGGGAGPPGALGRGGNPPPGPPPPP